MQIQATLDRVTGIRPHPLTWPGLDGGPTDKLTMRDHIGVVPATVADPDGDVVLVSHSGGGPVVQCAVDRSRRSLEAAAGGVCQDLS